MAEDLLWQRLRNSGQGFRFKRQYSVMNYVVDFYCHRGKLVIELDGEVHRISREYDSYRTKYLHSLGIKEIRSALLPSPEIRRGIEGEV